MNQTREGSYFDNQNQCSIYHITLLLKMIHMIIIILIVISVNNKFQLLIVLLY